MESFVAGAWRPITFAEIYIGGQWRRINRCEAYAGAQWRQTAVFADPLSLTATDANGTRRVNGPVLVTGISTATPVGGLAPYTYSTTVLTGSFTLTNAATATPAFSKVLDLEEIESGTARVTCTDAGGTVVTADFDVLLRNLGTIPSEGLF